MGNKLIELTPGLRFGRLVVLEPADKRYSYKCLCDCGANKIIQGGHLRSGTSKSCGCLRRQFAPRPPIDLTGQKFFQWTVLERAPKASNGGTCALWLCRCLCGELKIVQGRSLRSGDTKSCGCVRREQTGERFRTHGQSGDHQDRKPSPSYRSWRSMLHRCRNVNAPNYPQYGGKGVTVCDRWNPDKGGSFENFLEDLGERLPGTTLGRFGDVGPYIKSNCSWQNSAEQVANRRPDRPKRGPNKEKIVTEQKIAA
jgi:hypothetical protein